MMSQISAHEIRVGPRGGLFVYANNSKGSKRYLPGEAKDYVTDPVKLEAIQTLQEKRRAPKKKSLEKPTTTKKRASVTAVHVHVLSQRAYGQLPAALPAELGLLVAEMLDGDIRGGGKQSEMTLEQLDLTELVERKAAESKTSCADLLQTPEFGQAAVLKRATCLRNYRALRAPLLVYMNADLDVGFRDQYYAIDLGGWKAYLYLHDSSDEPNDIQARSFIERDGVTGRSTSQAPIKWREFALKYGIAGNGQKTGETERTFQRDDPYTLAAFLSDYFWLTEKGQVLIGRDPEHMRDLLTTIHPGLAVRQYRGPSVPWSRLIVQRHDF
jgi:hypothetical protein